MSTDSRDLRGLSAGAYLRKSRLEEGLDTKEVLSRHRSSLEECAKRYGLIVEDWYPEVVSGESLYARPQMLRLLEDVEAGRYDAILCVDLDRLSRGRMKDQGIILDTLKDSGTRIVTPEKVYDLSDEIDDELAEFKTFMSRREYKIIKKRLRRGLQRSIQDGCYVANAPYGYRKVTVDRRPTLEIYEEEAKFVRIMFRMYADGYGCTKIAYHVNAMGAHPHRSAEFGRSSVAKILSNPVYVGKVVWDQKSHIKKNSRGNEKHITIYNPREKWTIVDGLHPAIIDQELYDTVQDIYAGRYHPASNDGTIKSPLAGLVTCANCGGHMQRIYCTDKKGERTPYLICQRPGCCASAKYAYVEERILTYLRDTLDRLTIFPSSAAAPSVEPLQESVSSITRELSAAQRQKDRLHELLEIGEYDLPTYRERMAAVKSKLAALSAELEETRRNLQTAQDFDPDQRISNIRAVLSAYDSSDGPHRNALLHSVIRTISYHKPKKTKPLAFSLDIQLK